jgi:hypothetical protein
MQNVLRDLRQLKRELAREKISNKRIQQQFDELKQTKRRKVEPKATRHVYWLFLEKMRNFNYDVNQDRDVMREHKVMGIAIGHSEARRWRALFNLVVYWQYIFLDENFEACDSLASHDVFWNISTQAIVDPDLFLSMWNLKHELTPKQLAELDKYDDSEIDWNFVIAQAPRKEGCSVYISPKMHATNDSEICANIWNFYFNEQKQKRSLQEQLDPKQWAWVQCHRQRRLAAPWLTSLTLLPQELMDIILDYVSSERYETEKKEDHEDAFLNDDEEDEDKTERS